MPRAIVISICLSICSMVAAAGHAIEFSAQAVQIIPGQPEKVANIYVGNNRVRTDYKEDGHQRIEITDIRAHRSILLNPERQQYIERLASNQIVGSAIQENNTVNPCSALPNARCNKLGEEKVFGRTTQKWEVINDYQGQTIRALLWIDTEYNIPLRQIMPDGSVSELKPAGEEMLNGRIADKWEMITTQPDGTTKTAQQWIDRELKIGVREELPGGYMRELRNIVVAPQNVELFRIPAGYQQIQAPPPASRMTGNRQQ